MGEYKISSADIAIRCDATIDDLIDILEAKSRSYIPVIYALNKIDSISIEELDLLYRIPNACPISSEHGWNIDELLEQMWETLSLRRVYTKPKGKTPDYNEPVVLKKHACTVEDFVCIPPCCSRRSYKLTILLGSVTRSTRPFLTILNMLLFTAGLLSISRKGSGFLMNSPTRISVCYIRIYNYAK